MTDAAAPLRSFLFVPADSERKLARGSGSGADALILDLEDSVAPPNRPIARKQARAYLDGSEAAGPGHPQRHVRINPLASGLALDDLASVVGGRPDGILLPKCTPEDVRTLDHYLAAFETMAGIAPGRTKIVAIATETPQAMFALGNYAGVSPRLSGITWGAEDLAACIGGSNKRDNGLYEDVYRMARALCLMAAAAAGVAAIDTIMTDFRDDSGLAAECKEGRRAGFTAKMAIHPNQVAAINAAYSVGEDERRWAEQVVAAFAANPAAGTLALDGKMIDRPHLTLARRLLGLPPG